MDLKDSSHSTHSEDSVIVGILQKCFKYTFSCITQNILIGVSKYHGTIVFERNYR